MDEYGSTFVDPCRPLVVLLGLSSYVHDEVDSGLLQRNGLRIESATTELTKDAAEEIWQLFQECGSDTSNLHGGDHAENEIQSYEFHRCGRQYQFATRKAVPHASPADMAPQEITTLAASNLHSPLSPLSPGSPLYPDGIISPMWVWKHRFMTPAMLISFHMLTLDDKMQSLHDNQLKQDINAMRLRLDESHYRTRFGIVLLCERSTAEDSTLEDRLSNIRRTTKLDAKSSFFFIQTTLKKTDLRSTILLIAKALKVPTTEYFRDLTRHARRKRDRGTSPLLVSTPSTPTTPTFSQSLGRHEWNARYEFKLGIFADFRREPDVAARHYNAALDSLFHPDGFFENISNWSPRWNETRRLADVIAIRFIRCQLLNHLPSSAVLFWNHYRNRIFGILNRKGKGTSDYGWQAWQARWSTVMAELTNDYFYPLMSGAAIQSEIARNAGSAPSNVFLWAEKQIQSDDALHPWHLLHHPGYWYKLAIKYTTNRRHLAAKIPAEDKLPPGQSPAAAVARRSEIYDTYLCPDPPAECQNIADGGSIHDTILKDLLGKGIKHFSLRNQYRMANYIKLYLGKQLRVMKDGSEAHVKLKEAWKQNTWRREGWWNLIRDAAISLYMSAMECADLDMQIATSWELSHGKIGPTAGLVDDIMTLLERNNEEEHTVYLDASQIKSFLRVCCYFPRSHGHAGELIPMRIIIQSSAHDQVRDIVLDNAMIALEGSSARVIISNNAARRKNKPQSNSPLKEEISLSEDMSEGALWLGQADLVVAARETRILDCHIIPRETGKIEAKSIILKLRNGKFAIEYATNGPMHFNSSVLKDAEPFLPGIRTFRSSPHQCEILPKPPKLHINAIGMKKVYYLGEKATLTVQLLNDETQCIKAVIEARLLDGREEKYKTHWMNSGQDEISPTTLSWSTGTIEAQKTSKKNLCAQISSSPADLSLEIRAHYYLESDPNTPISKLSSFDAIIIQPFEANCNILPRLHPSPWPLFFKASDTSPSVGITTRWSVQASLQSLTTSPLIVSELSLVIDSIGAGCKSSIIDDKNFNKGNSIERSIPLSPRSILEREFVIDIQRADHDEQRTSLAAARLQILWRRPSPEDAEMVQTLINLPRLSFENGEPRVLASMVQPMHSNERPILVDFVLENPTLHFLSFGIAMESSESHAFSGIKTKTMNLLPMSRRTLRYSFLPLKSEIWMQAKFKVVDLYFNKTLTVMAIQPLQSTNEGVQLWIGE